MDSQISPHCHNYRREKSKSNFRRIPKCEKKFWQRLICLRSFEMAEISNVLINLDLDFKTYFLPFLKFLYF